MRFVTLHVHAPKSRMIVRADDIKRVQDHEGRTTVTMDDGATLVVADTVESISAQIRPVAECWA